MNIPSWILAAVAVAQLLIGGLLVWSLRQLIKDRVEKALEPIVTAIRSLEGRQTKVEAAIEHLPDQDQWIETVAGMRELRAEMKTFGAKLEGADKLVDRLQQQVNVMDDFLRRVKT